MEVEGKITQKIPVEKGTSQGGKDWQKQTLIINNGEEYNPEVAISFFGDKKVDMLAKYKVGQTVTVGVNLSSREHNGKWYNQIDGWKISGAEGAAQKSAPIAADDGDDVPF
tara:strand:+ start:3551 stop:3883 length:333 start_codon:yes stop_codon:yes gene_type:complete